MLTNGRPMKIELLGRLVSNWELTKNEHYYYNDIAINTKDKTYYMHLLTDIENIDHIKGQKVIIYGTIMNIDSYNNKPRITVFVEVITSA